MGEDRAGAAGLRAKNGPSGAEDAAAEAARADPLFIAAIERAMRVLETVSANHAPMSLTEIAAASGLGKSAAQRLTHTLSGLGYLRKDPETRRYAMTVRALDLAHGFLSADPMINNGLLHLIDARERNGETVNMGRLDGTDFIYVVRLPARRMNVAAALIGRRQPAYCASGGRAILSRMDPAEAEALIDSRPLRALTPMTLTDRGAVLERIEQARREGFSATDQEVLLGELAVSAPITDRNGAPVGAVQSSVSTASWTLEMVRERLAPRVMETARLISAPRY
ncbi:MAG: IclR family transcriptional regulator C-terminal domain-containing protein [Pseudomonadota bacterium]|nr:IclR family transcriptional regulator C-terminal domain-containing protein [Pseudomonadota bacterium]MEE3101298.1 IclR family transcriptional regulator C-terminal domain-containing protein [Pseudomonadota bacterium]